MCALQRTESVEECSDHWITFFKADYRQNEVGVDYGDKSLDFLFKVCMCVTVPKGKHMSHCRVNITVTCDKITLRRGIH